MKIAVISDVHSNIDALEAVLQDIENRSVDRIISTGDLLGYLPYPNEVVDCFKKNAIESIKGNHDKKVSEHVFDQTLLSLKTQQEMQSSASLLYTSKTITDDNRTYLRNLPEQARLEIGHIKILFLHGSPRKIDEYLYEDEMLLKSISEEMKCDVLVFGHTHIPYHRVINHKHFINAGSVGKPKHGNASSSYVVITIENNHITTEVHYVDYNPYKLCDEIKSNNMISDKLIDSVLNGI